MQGGRNRIDSIFSIVGRTIAPMMPGLFDQRGNRKYLIAPKRLAFAYPSNTPK
jgi:hypothetical protein